MSGPFGIAELMLNKGDSVVLMDSSSLDMKVVNTVYRSIITKRNKKKEIKNVDEHENDEK